MIVVNDKIYVGCGSNNTGNLGDWWEYDIISDTWSQKKVILLEMTDTILFILELVIMLTLGLDMEVYLGLEVILHQIHIYNDFYRYNPLNDSWLQLNDFPSEARVAGTQFSYNGKGYVLSGDGDDHGPLDSGEFWEYNPLNDSWNQLTSHPGGAIWAPGNFCYWLRCIFYVGSKLEFFYTY